MTKTKALILPALAGLLLAAGCGGDDNGGGDRLSKDEYTKQATAICTESQKKTDALKEPTKPEEVKTFLQQGIDITRENVNKFKDLNPPEDLQDEHDAAVKAEQQALDKLQEITDDLKGEASDAQVVQKAQGELESISKDVDTKLKAAGLDKCAAG